MVTTSKVSWRPSSDLGRTAVTKATFPIQAIVQDIRRWNRAFSLGWDKRYITRNAPSVPCAAVRRRLSILFPPEFGEEIENPVYRCWHFSMTLFQIDEYFKHKDNGKRATHYGYNTAPPSICEGHRYEVAHKPANY